MLLGGIGAAAAVLLAPVVRQPWRTRIALGAAGTGLLVLLAGPAAYSVETAASSTIGSLPSAGPNVSGGRGGFGGGPGGGGAPGAGRGPQRPGTTGGTPAITPPGGGSWTAPDGVAQGGGGAADGQLGTDGTQGDANLLVPPGGTGTLPGLQGNSGRSQDGAQAGPGGAAGAGGLLNASTPGEALTAALLADAASFTWVAATVGAQSAAGYQLATEQPVMAIGGFNGSDPSPTLQAFQAQVGDGRIHYFLASGRAGGFASVQGGSQAAAQITAWVQQTFTAQTIDGVTVYDLSTPAAGGGDTGSSSAAD